MDPSDLLLRPPLRKKRSLIRQISCWLPLPNAKRIHFQEEFLLSVQPCQTLHEETDQGSSYLPKSLWYTPAPVTLADVLWLVRDDGEEGILLRCQLYGTEPILASTPLTFQNRIHQSATQCCAHGQSSLDAPTQTPISSLSYSSSFVGHPSTPNSSHVTTDEAALERIRQLENDLMIMRQQLAAITMKQEQLNNAGNLDVSTATSLTSHSLGNMPPPVGVPGAAAPPPLGGSIAVPPAVAPPPPPPPPLPPAALLSTSKLSLKEIIKNNRKEKPSSSVRFVAKNQPDMAEILKGIGSVKLRSIKRSPGGTPIRNKPRAADVNDPAAIISLALKKKFAACIAFSPDKERSPDTSGFSPSPRRNPTPPGPHLLRSMTKRHTPTTPQHGSSSVKESGDPET